MYIIQSLAVLSGNIYEDMLNDASAAQTMFDDTLNNLWQDYILASPPHAIWVTVCILASLIALPLAAIRLMVDTKKFLEDERIEWEKVFYTICIALLLSNTGRLTADFSYGLYTLQDAVVVKVITNFKEAVSIENTFQKILGNNQSKNIYNLAHEVCQESYLSDMETYEACMDAELKKATATLENVPEEEKQAWHTQALESIKGFLGNLKENATKTLKYTVQSVTIAEKRLKLFLIGIVFNTFANVTLFLFTLFSPIVLAVSLMPQGEDAVIKYLTGFYFAGCVKLVFTILVALMGLIFEGSANLQEFLLAHGVGIYAPLMALGIAGGSSMMVFNSLSTAGMQMVGNISVANLFKKRN